MSVRVMAKVWDMSFLNACEKLLLLAVADHCNDDGVCYPSAERLRKKCGWSKATYTKYSAILEDVGLLNKTPRASTIDGRKTDLLRINHSKVYTCELMHRIRVSRQKFVRNNLKSLHVQNNEKINNLTPEKSTRVDTNHKGLGQAKKYSTNEQRQDINLTVIPDIEEEVQDQKISSELDIDAECFEIADELDKCFEVVR